MTVRYRTISLILGLVLVSNPLRANEDRSNAPVDFAREILPILSDKCFVCHGPDTRKKDLPRLDSFEGATKDLGGYQALNPDNPNKSEMLVRIHDVDDPMPPEDAEKKLSQTERELITRWVLQGGNYAKHWAFVPPQKNRATIEEFPAENAIDSFILAGLHDKGFSLAPEADRGTLARRAALVLTGLPPEPDQLAEFLNDKSANAYERFVDRLLANPRYGEHQARYWLDAVRYGDTHGLHLDNRRAIYPYRDWVVNALNENLPLDKFITWQLAGDLLPNSTLMQRLATGYVRMNPTTAEGGVLPEEFQAKNNFDRTETLGTVFLGMTLSCARCHTHKYDPIPQTEYYRLLAFFNSTAESSLDGNSYTYRPVIEVPENQADWKTWSALEVARDKLLASANLENAVDFSVAVAHAKATAGWSAENWLVSPAVDGGAAAPSHENETWTEAKGLPGVMKDHLPEPNQAIWVSFSLATPTNQTLWLAFSGGPGSHVQVDGKKVSAVSAPADEPTNERATTRIPLSLSKGSHLLRLKMTGTDQKTALEVRLENPWQPMVKAKNWDACPKKNRLLLLAEKDGPLAHLKLQKKARAVAQNIAEFKGNFTISLVAKDREKPRETHVLKRGEYNLPTGDPLEPGILSVMGAFPDNAPRNRLGLARWLTAREHPIVARVLINRVWQRTFGDGLVRTPEDFGLQGEQPTHPDLLDWLAVEVHESGWDLKHMLRLMVTSRTFRQQSARRSEVNDPENRLWARGPRHRLDAEVLRDLSLWASGLLESHMGGEGVKPYQPDGMWFALAHPGSNTKRYVRDKGTRLYRRSLYVYWKRTSPHPMMTLFDAPNRESSCVKRSRTNTSLQSLGLLNETQRLEMSRCLAERLLRENRTDKKRLQLLFRLLASRNPTAAEQAACSELLNSMRARYKDAKEDALALLSSGDRPRDESLDPAEHAAWSQVAITVLASDVALMLY